MSGAARYASIDLMPQHLRQQVLAKIGTAPVKKRSKYGAEPVLVDAIRFDSKREAAYYAKLKLRQLAGEIERFHRQVVFDLGGGIQYRCDFQVISTDGVEYIDVKGVKTKEFNLKRKLVRARYGVEIILV